MNDSAWEVPLGLDADYAVQVLDGDGNPVVFTGTETFTCAVWQGDDLTTVPGVVSASWTGGDPTQGKFTASVLGAGTTALKSDYYTVRITVLMGTGRVYRAYEGVLSLQDAPGSATAPTTYCGLQDMLDLCGDWLAPLMQASGKTAFLPERARAKRRLDQAVLSRSRPLAMWYGPAAVSDRLISMQFGGAEQPDYYLQQLLAAGRLIVTPEVVEATAYLAAAFVCERQLTWDQNDPHAARARYYHGLWRLRLLTLNPGVDVNGDGVAEWYFDMAYVSSR